MQINSISNQNFKGVGTTTPTRSFKTSNEEFNQEIELLDKLADKARSDVHPSTIIATIAAVLLTAKTAHKIVPLVRRVAVTAGEAVTKGVAKLGSDIANKFKKADKIDTAEVLENIGNKADKLRDGNKDSKLLKNIEKTVKKITGNEEKAQEFVQKLEKAGIKDGVSAFDATAAVVAGAVAMDPASDKAEEIADDYAIANGIAEIAEFIGHA